MSLTVIGTEQEISALWDVYINISGNLYTLTDQSHESPYSYSKMIDEWWHDDDHEKQYKVIFEGWAKISEVWPTFSVEEVKQMFPQWAEDIELSLLQDLL